jgi:creatinine amidohydrolase
MKEEAIYSVHGPKNLAEMTTEEIGEALKQTDLVILPVGSTEEHGPHLPLACDTIQGIEVSKRIVSGLAAEGIGAVAGPPIPFGVSFHLMEFPGTISLTTATLTTLINEVCASLIKHGFRKIVMLAAHVENLGVCYSAAQDLSLHPGVNVLVINWLPLLRKYSPEILKSKWGGHGGEGETAAVLASAPGLVRMDRAQKGPFPPAGQKKVEGDDPIHFGGGIFEPSLGMKKESPVGFFGDPTVATAETGEKYYAVIVDFSCQVIKKHFGL